MVTERVVIFTVALIVVIFAVAQAVFGIGFIVEGARHGLLCCPARH